MSRLLSDPNHLQKKEMNKTTTLFLILISLNCNSQVSLRDYYSPRILGDKNISKVQQDINKNSFEISRNTNSIDPCILFFLFKFTESNFQIANPNKPYNVTDVVDNTLPDRQLKIVFKSKISYFIIYAHGGGAGFHYHIAWFELKNNKVDDFWICNSFNQLNNFGELKKFINTFDRTIILKNGRKFKTNYLCL